MSKTDIELIQEYVQQKNMGSFEELLLRYIKELHRFIVVQIGHSNAEYSNDIIQDVSIKIWKNINSYNSNKSSFKTWAYNIARNTAIDWLRSKKQNIVSIEDVEDVLVDNSENSCDQYDESFMDSISQVVETFDIDIKTIFFLKIEQDMTFKEIGETMGKPLNTVKSLYARSIDKIKKNISKTI